MSIRHAGSPLLVRHAKPDITGETQGVVDSDPPRPCAANELRNPPFIGLSWAWRFGVRRSLRFKEQTILKIFQAVADRHHDLGVVAIPRWVT